MNAPPILIAGIGNIFQGDDAFGSELARRLLMRSWPDNVRVEDFGIRGIDLTYALTDGYDIAILIDAIDRGGEPGTLYLIKPKLDGSSPQGTLDAHSLDPLRVLLQAQAWGAELTNVYLVGCQPGELGGDEGCLGLSPAVEAAIDEGARMVESLVARLLETSPIPS